MRIRVTLPKGEVFEWSGHDLPMRIGRLEHCALQFDDQAGATVSREHCEISVDEAGAWRLADLGSSNGTYLNGKQIGASAPLHVGAVIQVGRLGPLLEVLELTPGSPLPAATSERHEAGQGGATQDAPQAAAKRPIRAVKLPGTLLGLFIGGLLGVALGYYVLCALYPFKYNVLNLPVPASLNRYPHIGPSR